MADQDSPVTLPVADCSLCPFRGKTLLMGRCMPGDTCVFINSGRQIDRFFRVNPAYAAHYLQDKFWERRAIAVRYAPLKTLLPLIEDEDEVVRRAVAFRLPAQQLQALIDDPDREVRMTVADRIDLEHLELLANDPDYIVRLMVAKRLAPGRLFRFIKDEDLQVRKRVAERLPEVSLGLMANDRSPDVRRIVAERMSPEDATMLLSDSDSDSDWVVRYTAALKVDPANLAALADDPEPDVRELVQQRLNSISSPKADHD
jgi:hypothetical protein